MKKNLCYPKYSYNIYLILSAFLLLFSFGPIFFNTNEDLVIKLIWSGTMILFSLCMFIGYLWTKQEYFIKDSRIVIRNIFCKIIDLDLKECTVQIIELPTYFSWVSSINIKWICIYEKNKYIPRFKSGCANSKKHRIIQIKFSESVYDEISKLINMSKMEK